MFNKKSSRHSLALFVALALGSGTLLTPSAAGAADVSGQNVAIDDAHAPSDNAEHPGGGPAFGTAAGFIKEEANSGNVTSNTLTFKNIHYTKQLYGGLTFGTGNVTGNRVIVNSATGTFFSNTDGIFGGAANGGGNVEDNHAVFNGNQLNGDLVGGMTKGTGTGIVKDNTALLKSGNATTVYGGIAAAGTNGDVLHNQATIENGHTGMVYGGYADENGNVKNNIVTIKGGIMTGVEGGHSDGTGEVSGNTVNLGDGTSAMAAGYAINGTIYGGRNDSHPDKVSNNTLNVNTNAVAHNIKNFSTINFNFNAHTNAASSLLTLSDSAGTQIASLEQIHLSGAPLDKSEGTLIENTHGITVANYSGAVSRTMEKTESIIDRDGTNKIGYKYYQFKGSTEAKSDSTAIWGGRSILGNTTTGNEVTVSGNHLPRSAYGGLTSGTGSTATGENATTHSMNNKITLTGTSTSVHHMSGGMTLSAGGNAIGNHAILNAGTVHGQIHGGTAVSGNATGNFVDINGGTVISITVGGAANGSGKSAKNIVKLTGGSALDVYGGHSHGGDTEGNSVEISGGTARSIYGGESGGTGKATENTVTLKGGTLSGDIFGGIAANGDAVKNHVNIEGGSTSGHDAYGGWSTSGNATGNTVNITGGSVRDVYGGRAASGNATKNIVSLANATVNSITGGDGTTTNNNTVKLKGNTQVTGALKGGTAANGTGNTLNVTGTNNKAGSISGFQKLTFDTTNTDANPMLKVTGGAAADVDWTTLTATGAASETPKTLMENVTGINTNGRTGDAVKSELNTDATMETNIDVVKSGDKVTALTYEGYTFKGSTKTTTYGADTWAGRSKAGNTTQDNTLTLDDAGKTYTNVYGGWTSGTGTKAAADKQNNSLNNTVNYTAGTVTGTLYGGYTAAGEASGNTVNLGAVTTAANIYGGFGTVTKNNTINLKGARVTGTVYGGSAANGTGNTLAVYKPSEVHNFAGIQNLHFYTDEMAAGATTPMLKLGTATKDIRGLNIGVARSGAAPKLIKGDKILLMKTAGGALTTDAAIQNKVEGMQGVSRRYEYEIKQEATGELTATVTKAGFAEQAKSLVETRAGLASFVNQGADYLVQDGLAAAQMSVSASDADKGGKNAQRKAVASDGAAYQLWAGAGANSMRAESGSYVDSKGWNLGVGWAREDVQKDGAKVLFSPFVEYGRGTYDSYLDDGTHGSGKISYIGAGILGKLTQKDGLWLEGSLRAGRAKSDYSANLSGTAASYDGSNTYYGAHLGAGKTFAIKEGSSIDAYARYFWSHQNSMTATLNTGDRYEFGSVNSQRLRLGFRYSLKDKTTGEFYAGLAWEHEFAGKAGATYEGDAAPSPSLKGSSYMLELGYRFMPENSRVSYDLHLNGWQGQRKGITGGASVKWAF